MILVDATGLRAERPDRVLFADLSVTISSGDRLAVVGVNGTGKSTLLGALAGPRSPEDNATVPAAVDGHGTIRRGRGARVSHLDQDAPLPPGTVGSVTGARWEAAAIRDRLDLSSLLERPTDQLSGGQVKRVALARALLVCGPPDGGPPDADDLLVLDEPTNHLDVDAIAWLEEWLAGFRGGLVLVTHDRHVLDRVTTRILELDRGHAHVHDGGYASYLEARAERAERADAAEARRRNLARRELAWLRRGAPARTSKPKAHIEAAVAVIEGAPSTRDGRDVALDLHAETPRLGDRVVEAAGIGARVGGRWLFEGLDLVLDNRERLGMVGPNGAGKTTLLRILDGSHAPDAGTIAFGPTVRIATFSQDAAEIDPARRVRDVVTGGKDAVSWVDTALMERFWFDDDAQWAPVGTLSGGERRRLQLLLALRSRPNVLLLDEPTNDLDLDTLRSLEDFLDDWPGALVVVSHDRALLERTTTDVLALDGRGRAGRVAGGLTAWLDGRAGSRARGKATARASDRPVAASPSQPEPRTADRGRSPSTLRRALNQAERDLHRATEGRDALVVDLEAATDHTAAAEIGAALTVAQAALDAAEEAWLGLAEEAEEANPGLL